MDWGKSYEKATYPERTKRKVELFDIREFVKAAKKKKMEEMMNSDNGSQDLMMNQGLFGGMPPMMNPGFPSGNPSGGFNADDLVKRIDAKLAELEEEERQEKAKEEAEKNRLKEEAEQNKVKEAEYEEKVNLETLSNKDIYSTKVSRTSKQSI